MSNPFWPNLWKVVDWATRCHKINSKKTQALVFSCEFCEVSKNTFFTEHPWTTASVYLFMNLFIHSFIG